MAPDVRSIRIQQWIHPFPCQITKLLQIWNLVFQLWIWKAKFLNSRKHYFRFHRGIFKERQRIQESLFRWSKVLDEIDPNPSDRLFQIASLEGILLPISVRFRLTPGKRHKISAQIAVEHTLISKTYLTKDSARWLPDDCDWLVRRWRNGYWLCHARWKNAQWPVVKFTSRITRTSQTAQRSLIDSGARSRITNAQQSEFWSSYRVLSRRNQDWKCRSHWSHQHSGINQKNYWRKGTHWRLKRRSW